MYDQKSVANYYQKTKDYYDLRGNLITYIAHLKKHENSLIPSYDVCDTLQVILDRLENKRRWQQ
jgi:hypothetical protein